MQTDEINNVSKFGVISLTLSKVMLRTVPQTP